MEEELSDGDIVWVKVSNSWWPGEVMGDSRLSEEFLSSLRKKPLAVVKFFQEDTYEFVKNPNCIFKYNCPRKMEFLRKGLEQYRAKMKHMETFPADVMHAERATGGDPDIVNSTDFLPQKKERYSGSFLDVRSTGGKSKGQSEKVNTQTHLSTTPFPAGSRRKTVHEVRILAQSSSTPSKNETGGLTPSAEKASPAGGLQIVQSPGSQMYNCYKCSYSTSRQNLLMVHIKYCQAIPGSSSGAFSAATKVAMTPAPKGSIEKDDDSDEDDDPKPGIKPDHSRRSLLLAGKAKPVETPIREVAAQVPAKIELSNEKRTRGGRKSTPMSEAPKQNKAAVRRRTKRDHSPLVMDDDKPSSANVSGLVDSQSSVKTKEADEKEGEEHHRSKTEKVVGAASHEESTASSTVKNKTDVKLKNELLADWSEDEQEDDEGEKKEGIAEKVDEKMPPEENQSSSTPSKDASPVRTTKASTKKNQQKESKQEAMKQPSTSKKATNMEAQNETSAFASKDEERVVVKGTEKDNDSLPESSAVVATTTAPVLATAATTSAGAAAAGTALSTSTSGVAPTASPYATIKYRNIPKKQKREFVEVTNDDVSMVQEKYAVPSREGSTASSSSTTGSNESCTGTAQSTAALPTVPAAERPISAKQLILNRATRGSSKSLSGDEITTGITPITVEQSNTTDSKDIIKVAQEERKSQTDDTAKKTDARTTPLKQNSSCFDFNDDEDDHHPGREVTPTSQTLTATTRFDRKRDQAARQKPAMVAPEAPEVDRDAQLSQEIDSLLCETDVPKLPEDLSDVMTAVTDKIDCNRTLPPKERGKRIFKTRNKTVTASSSSSPKQVEEVSVEAEVVKNNGDSESIVHKATVEQQKEVHEKEKQTIQEKDKSTKQEDHQNPSVTSSAMAEDGSIEGEERPQQPEQSQSSKNKRKSEEVLLPDSSGNGDQQPVSATRRRGKNSRAAVEVKDKASTTQQTLEARETSSSARKGKRPRREGSAAHEVVSATNSGDKSDVDGVNTTDRIVSSEMENITAMDTEDVTDSSNVKDTPKQQTPATLDKHAKTKREESVADTKPAAPSTSLAAKATPTDLQVAEALINLPTVVAAPLPVSSSSISGVVEKEKIAPNSLSTAVESVKETETIASSSSQAESVEKTAPNSTASSSSSSSNSTATKSINPRKRALQSMMLDTTEATNPPQSKKVVAAEALSSASGIEKEITTVKVVLPPEQDAPSIPEKKKRNEVEPDDRMPSKESSSLLAEADKFDINSMPIVMDDSELLVDDTSSSTPTSGAITVTKSVNGAGSAAKTSQPVMVTAKEKRPTTVAVVKGGKAASEQIVITSKGTVLTTSTTSISVASKHPTSSSKSSVTVTSAITLSSSCRVASSTPASSSVSSPLSSAPSASPASPQLVSPKIIITKKPLPQAASTSTASSKAGGSVEGSKAAPTERRLSGDGASSSVSSSSGSEAAAGKKSHRVLRLTPQKLKEFSRLGYIEERQGKGKMLTKSGMRQLYGKQPQLQQQQQQQHLSKKKPEPVSTKNITTTGSDGDGADLAVAPDSHSGPRSTTALPEVASSGSNVVIAAAADSSVQESSATVERTASSDTNAVEMEEDEEMLEQQKVASSEMGEQLPVSTHVAPAGATIVLEGSPSSSGTGGGGAAEVILGSPELAIVGGGSITEASSSSSSGSGATATTAGSGEQESSQLMAVSAENFGGPPNLFYLCSVRDESLVPVNNELLYLDASNQLVALEDQSQQQHPAQQQVAGVQQAAGTLTEEIINQAEVIIPTVGSNGAEMVGDGSGGEGGSVTAAGAVGTDGAQESFVFNTQDGQHIILDPQSLMALAAGGETPHLITADGQEIILQETAQEWLAALQQQQQHQQAGAVSTLVTPEGTQIIVAHENTGLIELQEHPVLLPSEIIQVNPNTTIETNAVLTKPPIMSTVEVPSKNGIESVSRAGDRTSAAAVVSPRKAAISTTTATGGAATASNSKVATMSAGTGSNLDETLAAVIGHVPSNPHVPTSLELPITVTNPVIAKTSTAGSRLNAVAAAAQLFPLTTTTTTAVSSFADALQPAATVVLVSGADVPGTIDSHPRSTSPLAATSCPSPSEVPAEEETIKEHIREEESEKDSMMTVQKEGNDDGDNEGDDEGVSEKDKSACLDEDDIQIPNTPESVHNNDERQQHYDDELRELDGEQHESNENHLLLVDENSNCSEIIAIQPNVVVLDGDMLLNSPRDEDDDDEEDDGIDDDLMENDSEADDVMAIGDEQQQQQQQLQHIPQAEQDTVQARSFDQRPLQQHQRQRNNAPPTAANGTNGRQDTMNLAEHHNSSSNNDSGIDTNMAVGVAVGSAACEAAITAATGPPAGEGSTERRTIVER